MTTTAAETSLLERLGRWNLRRLGATSTRTPIADLVLHAYTFAPDPKATTTSPPLVLMHGVGSSATTFSKLIRRLRSHVGPIALPEAPGHGYSTIPDVPLSPDALFERIAAWLDEVPEAPFVLYGNSLGGGAALRYAILRPDRVAALILLSPAGANAASDELSALVKTFEFSDKGDARRFVRRLFNKPRWYFGLASGELARRFASPPLREFFARVGIDDLLDGERVRSLAMPILFMWGGAEKLLPAAHLDWFKHHLPAHAEVVEPPHFAHSAYVEHAGEVADLIVGFLGRHGLMSPRAEPEPPVPSSPD